MKIENIFRNKDSFNDYITSLISKDKESNMLLDKESSTLFLKIYTSYLEDMFKFKRKIITNSKHKEKVCMIVDAVVKHIGFKYGTINEMEHLEIMLRESSKNHIFENEDMIKVFNHEEGILRDGFNNLSTSISFNEKNINNFDFVFINIIGTIEYLTTHVPYDNDFKNKINEFFTELKRLISTLS